MTRADTRTPGPWRAHGFVVATGTGYSRAVIARMERLGETSLLIGPGEAHANARAIAELPALEEAARAVRGMIDAWMNDTPSARPGEIGEAVELDTEGAAMIITDAYSRLGAALARMDGGDDA